MSYKLTAGGVIRKEDGASIPATNDNADWLAYKRWLALGNVPEAADPVASAQADELAAELSTDKAFDDLGRAIDQGDTKTALTLVKQLLQEKR